MTNTSSASKPFLQAPAWTPVHWVLPALLLLYLIGTACTVHRGGVHVEQGRRVEYGQASWYGKDFHGRRTANGEIYDMYKISAAHKTLPLGTRVKVTNRNNGRTVTVRINDRGPFVRGRIIDLSYGGAKALGMVETGVVPVKVEVLSLGDNRYYKTGGQPVPSPLHFTVQVGSFLQEGNAQTLKRSLAARFKDVYIYRWDDSRRVYFRVRVGRFAREADARLMARKLKAARFSTFVTAE